MTSQSFPEMRVALAAGMSESHWIVPAGGSVAPATVPA